jgi:hypothetical protein
MSLLVPIVYKTWKHGFSTNNSLLNKKSLIKHFRLFAPYRMVGVQNYHSTVVPPTKIVTFLNKKVTP